MNGVSIEARQAMIAICGFVSGTGPVVSADEAELAAHVVLMEFDAIDKAAIRGLWYAGAGFLLGGLTVLLAMFSGMTHP